MEIIKDKNGNSFIFLKNKDGYNQDNLMCLRKFGIYEPGLYQFIENIYPKLNCDFFDIGASNGIFSLLAAKFSPSTSVFSFEPHPKTFDLLEKNIKINKYLNIKPYNYGISYKDEVITTIDFNEDCGINLSRTDGEDKGKVDIILKKLNEDEFNSKKRLIKIDIEQYEYIALSGNKNFVDSKNTIGVISEFFPDPGKKKQLFDFLNDIFPFTYVIDENLSVVDWKFKYRKPIKEDFINPNLMNIGFFREDILK